MYYLRNGNDLESKCVKVDITESVPVETIAGNDSAGETLTKDKKYSKILHHIVCQLVNNFKSGDIGKYEANLQTKTIFILRFYANAPLAYYDKHFHVKVTAKFDTCCF